MINKQWANFTAKLSKCHQLHYLGLHGLHDLKMRYKDKALVSALEQLPLLAELDLSWNKLTAEMVKH